jgi:chromate transporter
MDAPAGEMAAAVPTAPSHANARPSLRDTFREFLLIGLTSVGGGRATFFQDAFVRRRQWMSEEEFLEAVAVSQVLPGPNIGNLAAYLGQKLRGWPGALIAVLCLTVPGGVAITFLAWLYYNGMPASITEPVSAGVGAASAGLAAAAAWRLRRGAGNPAGVGVAVLTFVLFGPLGWNIFLVLCICLPISLVLAARRR